MNLDEILAEQTAAIEAERAKLPESERAPVVPVPRPRKPEPKK